MALLSFLEQNNLSGKNVYLFCSHGTGGLANSVELITEAAPKAMAVERRRISVQFEGGTVVYELNDGTAADSLYEQLPLTIEVSGMITIEVLE